MICSSFPIHVSSWIISSVSTSPICSIVSVEFCIFSVTSSLFWDILFAFCFSSVMMDSSWSLASLMSCVFNSPFLIALIFSFSSEIFSFSSEIFSFVLVMSIFDWSSSVGSAASACGIVNNIPIKLRITGSTVLVGSVIVTSIVSCSNSFSSSDNNSKEFSSSSSSFIKTSDSS